MAGSYEKNIRWKAIGIYLFIAVICIAVSLYIYSLSRNISSQKQHIENYSELLQITNQIVFSVSEAQSTANLYLNSKNSSHLRAFRTKVAETESLIDSLAVLSRLAGDTSNLGQLMEIGGLLRQKGDIIQRLNTQLTSYNPIDSLASRLFSRDNPLVVQDSVLITTVVSDTVVTVAERQNFWDRMSNVFAPERSRDTLMTIQSVQTDTVRSVIQDPGGPEPRAREYMEQVRSDYSSNLRALEREINRLITNDQEITVQIIEVLNRFHRGIINSTVRHIEDSEEAIGRNYSYSFAGIVISLLLVTFFILLIINDTNKGQRARMELETAHARIREIMASRHKLLLSVSHDVKTPLNAILGYLELWKQGHGPESGEISAAELSGKHINALIGNLLEFSSLEQGTARPSPGTFGVLSFCEETAGMIRPQARRKGLLFETRYRMPRDLYIEADSMRLRQIILNILSNAVKYTAEGTVTFQASYKDGKVRFIVTDTGKGMDADELDRIFKPFYRIEGSSEMAEGHGFGMFVVKGLAELLGGELDIRSAPGEGTTVEVRIPAPVSELFIPQGQKRILFIDDDTVLLKILSGMAATLGHRCECISDPGIVVDGKVDVSRYDMVITDMEMGSYRGSDVLVSVKERLPDMHVVVMTGHHDLSALSASESGFDGYLAKPISIRSLEMITGSIREKNDNPDAPGSGPTPADAAPAGHRLPESLTALFGEGEELQEIIETFRTATREDLKTLRSAVFRRDRRTAKAICHRLLPLFRQFGSDKCTRLLLGINSTMPDQTAKPGFWKDINLFIETAAAFLDDLGQ